MKLDIFLRTYDGDAINGRPRFIECTKLDLICRCAKSLATAIKHAREHTEYDIQLTIIDDHSSKKTLRSLKKVVKDVKPIWDPLEETGNNASMIYNITVAKNSTADKVYMVEDDYLHEPEALTEMLNVYNRFSINIGRENIAMSPLDDPANYNFKPDQCIIVPGDTRPWRTHNSTGSTYFTTPNVMNEHWDTFYKLASEYPKVQPTTTRNHIWAFHVPLFTPLFPLAYHLFDHEPVFQNIDKLWEDNKV